jgi:TRAP-type uncharacterized transport system substrate-binding protein
VKISLFLFSIFLFGCATDYERFQIAGNVHEPYNQIANTIAAIHNRNSTDSLVVQRGIGSMANMDSLIAGVTDVAILDNYSPYAHKISSIMPLYPQVLHILQRRTDNPVTITDLLVGKKVFAGMDGSGIKRFVLHLMDDYGIEQTDVPFLDIVDLFDADVIFSLTDLLSAEELRDLQEYKLYSIDHVNNLGRGSLAEGICTRYPQFEPYIISRNVYGDFTESPVLTLKMDAILVGRNDLSDEFVFNLIETLHDRKQAIVSINPLLYNFSGDFNPENMNFALHDGARQFLLRSQPSFFEKYAELLSVIISILVATVSALFTVARWRKINKKNKIDVYYNQLIGLRNELTRSQSSDGIRSISDSIRSMQEETIKLVVSEQLLADESFSIFLNLSRIVMDEANEKLAVA